MVVLHRYDRGGAVRKDRLFPRRASDIPIREIVDRLSGNIGALCEYLLPNGRREGGEWRCGSVQGEPGKSLGVQGKSSYLPRARGKGRCPAGTSEPSGWTTGDQSLASLVVERRAKSSGSTGVRRREPKHRDKLGGYQPHTLPACNL